MIFRRRRRTKPSARASFHDSDAAATASLWLSALSIECAAHGVPVPPIITVELDESSITLRLAAPRVDCAPPWTASSDGAAWTRPLGVSGRFPGGGVPRGLTAIGLLGRPTMLVDLCRSGAPISLTGEPAARLEVAHRWVDERSRAPWSRGFPLLLDELPELATADTIATSTRQLINTVAMGGEGIAFVRDAPSGQNGRDLRAIVGAPGCRWAVVVLGTAPARWTFVARPDGAVTSEVFPDASVDHIGAALEVAAR